MAEILVLGAGMVGVSTALALQEHGHQVVLVDRREPGRETSYGNAGIIQAEAAEPYALPRDLPTLLRYALGASNDVTWSIRGVLGQAPALLRYFRNSSAKRHASLAKVYCQLTSVAPADHAPLIEAAGAGNLIAREGILFVFRSEKELAGMVSDLERLELTYGVTSRVLDRAAVRREEPSLKLDPAGAIHYDQSWSCADPGTLTQLYADLFAQRGGSVVQADAFSTKRDGAAWYLPSGEGRLTAEHVVVALGPWSPAFLKRFGYRIPMIFKRGYHGHFNAPMTLQRPFLDVENGVVAASMRTGLRVSTGAALVANDAPADPRQLDAGVKGLRSLIDTGDPIDEPLWFGSRPCLADMLPLVGAAPRDSGLWFNFGHGHQGFTLGPTTGRLLAGAMAGEDSAIASALAPAGRVHTKER